MTLRGVFKLLNSSKLPVFYKSVLLEPYKPPLNDVRRLPVRIKSHCIDRNLTTRWYISGTDTLTTTTVRPVGFRSPIQILLWDNPRLGPFASAFYQSGAWLFFMVAVAQLVERRVVVSAVEGSSPFSHP